MKLEDQVTNKELSDRLKELGVKQESLFWWIKRTPRGAKMKHGEYGLSHVTGTHGQAKSKKQEIISAFTVAELGEMLRPKEVVGSATFITKKGLWRCVPPVQLQHLPSVEADTEADARAKMLIYLLENRLITP